jgi:hypothetical protein
MLHETEGASVPPGVWAKFTVDAQRGLRYAMQQVEDPLCRADIGDAIITAAERWERGRQQTERAQQVRLLRRLLAAPLSRFP